MRWLLARGVHAGLVMFVASCTEVDPLYCPQHPEDLVNCAPANCTVVAALGVTVCPENFPSAVMIGSNVSIDTTTGASNTGIDCARLVSPSSDVCVVHGSSISIAAGARLAAYGARPLVVLASTAIAIEGTLDVASRNGVLGPAADPIDCIPGMSPTDNGGGQGGSFTTSGGAGGSAVNTIGTGGRPGPVAPSGNKLRGGCPGAAGSNSGGGSGGAGGNGGGAVLLIGDMVTIGATGVVNASGSSGAGSLQGGGGGGTGGMIAFHAPSVSVIAGGQVFANGGHGGEGGGSTTPGQNGTDPDSYTSGGGGGAGATTSGGDGGAGFPSMTNDGADGTGTAGSGGGGGGGAGSILVLGGGSLSGVVGVSPPP